MLPLRRGLSTKPMMWFCRTEPSWNLIRKVISQRLTASREKVPVKLIPQAIRNYLMENYPAQAVKKIEMNKNEYEVELANGLDLTFNKHFQLIDID